MKYLLLFCYGFTFCSFAFAQADPNDPQMKAWMEYMTPGPQHQEMAKAAGDWKVSSTMWMDPSAPPMKSEATAHNEMVMGGRYLMTRYSGKAMDMPFEGTGVMGYDNGKKMYFTTWMDNMGTGFMYLEGTKSADGKTLEFKGKMYDAAQGKDVKVREVHTFIDENHQKMEMYSEMGGKEMKNLELVMTR